MTNTEKAKLYDQLLSEHARKASQVRALEVDIRPAPDQQQKINKLKQEMVDLEKRATELSMSAF
jgi:cell division protein FtsB